MTKLATYQPARYLDRV